MKTKRLVLCLAVMAMMVLGFSEAHAFNPATHVYISEHLYPRYAWSIDLAYGAIAPDIDQYVSDPARWPTAYEDTHLNYSNLRPWAIGSTQKVFALGWHSHGEQCGADRYAHLMDPYTGRPGGYVIFMSGVLNNSLISLGLSPLPEDVAHFAIETAVDLLMQNNVDRSLALKVLRASLFRSWEDRNLLTRVLVLRDRRTDFLTLATSELTFRTIVDRYASALALPEPLNIQAAADLGAQLSQELFGLPATKEELLQILHLALALCEGTYESAIINTISRIAADPACR